VAGYADAMDMVFESFESITITENHTKQLHGVLLKYSSKDQEHCEHYKKVPNHVEAFGPMVRGWALCLRRPILRERSANVLGVARQT
jgi:hypothetical protein